MARQLLKINPVSRVEGHGKVTIHLDDEGMVEEARFHILQFRGFEVFCQGRPFEEMPIITQRICGICPVSHQLGSAKACDAILGLSPPPAARMLRELLHMGQYIQSHALHFFHLASPDLLLGWDADPAVRNVVGVIGAFPELAVKGIRLRKFGQEIISALAGKKVHPAFAIPGGVTDPLLPEVRDRLLEWFPEAYATASAALELLGAWVEKNTGEIERFANFDSNYLGLVDEEGRLNLYDGRLRLVAPDGRLKAEFEPAEYASQLAERTEAWSYMKFPYYAGDGYPAGMYRVGPLARLRVCDGITTPRASAEWDRFRQMSKNGFGGCSLMYHYTRLVELVHALERAEELLRHPGICGTPVQYTGPVVNQTGVGVVEAPRGTLIHHYEVDDQGAMVKANLIVATGHNNLAMNKAVTLVAKEYIRGGEVREGVLNRVEGAIRCYDPCLSCATHAVGQMPLKITVYDVQGNTLHEIVSD